MQVLRKANHTDKGYDTGVDAKFQYLAEDSKGAQSVVVLPIDTTYADVATKVLNGRNVQVK